MNQFQHIMNAIAIATVFLLFIYPSWYFWAVPLGALFPDLDINLQKAKMGRHRKTLHNLFVPFLAIAVGVSTGTQEFMMFFIIGLMSHLLADSISKTGIYPFYPISKFCTGGGISFTKPAGGGNPIEKLEKELKVLLAQLVFVVFTLGELFVLMVFRSDIRTIITAVI